MVLGFTAAAKRDLGTYPLHKAVLHEDIDLVRRLIKIRENVNLRDHKLKTPLHFAAGTARFRIVRLLLENGANAEAVDINGMTPMDHAFQSWNLKCRELLKTHLEALLERRRVARKVLAYRQRGGTLAAIPIALFLEIMNLAQEKKNSKLKIKNTPL